jgi:hypothetical protein
MQQLAAPEAEADGGAGPHHAREDRLRAQPGADLRHDLARRGVDVRAPPRARNVIYLNSGPASISR